MSLGMYDYVVVIAFSIVLFLLGFYRSQNTNDFLLAGRRLTLPLFVATLVATVYGGVGGIAEFASRYGLAVWLTQGIFWYIIYLIFALFLAIRIQKMPYYTIPDILENHYNKHVAKIGSILTYILLNPAAYLFSMGTVVVMLVPISLGWAVILVSVFAVLYTIFNGFRAVVVTDVWQFFWMYLGFGILFIATLRCFGGPEFLQTSFALSPEYSNHLKITGSMSLWEILAWAGLALWSLVDPNFYQRCYAAQKPEVARKGILWSIVFWATFDVFSCTTALYAVAGKTCGILHFASANVAHLALADYVLPQGLKGLFLASILATIMSTADSCLFSAGVTISRDYYWRFFNPKATQEQMKQATRIAIVFTAILACILAIILPSVVDLWYTLGTISIAGLLIPVLGCFCRMKQSYHAGLYSMLFGTFSAIGWFLYGWIHQNANGPQYIWDCQPLYIGFAASLLGWGVGILFSTTPSE